MTTTERLLRAAEPIWAGYHTHPFVRGIRDGTLDREKFRFYMIQDYRYLVEYSKVFAVGIAKGTQLEVMQLFASYIQAILNEEMNIHNGYVGLLNITQEELDDAPMTLENRSYTAYMLAQAYAGGEAEVLTAILSCAVSYEEIGRRMVRERPESLEDPFYGAWVRGYAGEEYHQNNEELIAMLERLTAGWDETRLARLEEIFVTCSQYEGAFWDMAWRGR